jgi:hypothetical protein
MFNHGALAITDSFICPLWQTLESCCYNANCGYSVAMYEIMSLLTNLYVDILLRLCMWCQCLHLSDVFLNHYNKTVPQSTCPTITSKMHVRKQAELSFIRIGGDQVWKCYATVWLPLIPYLKGTTFYKLRNTCEKKCAEHFFFKTCFLVLMISLNFKVEIYCAPANVQLLTSLPGCILGRKKKHGLHLTQTFVITVNAVKTT